MYSNFTQKELTEEKGKVNRELNSLLGNMSCMSDKTKQKVNSLTSNLEEIKSHMKASDGA